MCANSLRPPQQRVNVQAETELREGGMSEEYRLDDAVGFLLRRANQRHLSVFGAVIPELTTTQLAAMARLAELGPMSQNQLGRVTAMDAATIKGVVGRLVTRRLVATVPSEEDRRRLIVDLTPEGRALFESLRARAREASEQTLAPLSAAERDRFLAMLRRLV
jgi:DNA-binding MarR family transcriptional regulator